jgi:cystathionine beta-synthase
LTVADLLEKKDTELQELVYLQPSQSVQEALALMEKHDVSQVPVAKGEMPIAAAEVLGSISKSWILTQPNEQDELLDIPVEKIMEPALPAVGLGTSVDLVIEIFHESSALLVFDGGRPKTVITRADIGENPSMEGA